MAQLSAAIAAGLVCWSATAPMRGECFHVLDRGSLDRWQPDRARLESAWNRWCLQVELPANLRRADPGLRCSDPMDQMFIDLAAGLQARWLVSKDRAVRRLAAPLLRLGVQVLTPAQWPGAAAVDGPVVDAR